MKSADILVGPVLSFRGSARQGEQVTWKVTAMIAVPAGAEPPVMELEGTAVAAPVVLVARNRFTVLRYDLSSPVEQEDRRVAYGIPALALQWEFTVPGKHLRVRFGYASCNGFSDPRAMRSLSNPASAVWSDLVANHDLTLANATLQPAPPIDREQLWHVDRGHGTDVQRFHVLLLGGDQIYFDSMWDDIKELKQWAELARDKQLSAPMPAALRQKVEEYYFQKYLDRWLSDKRGPWDRARKDGFDQADAFARIPTVMMWDDHDIYDGWGSYSQEMQRAAVPQEIFKCARRAFWVYQMQHRLDDLPELVPSAVQLVDAPCFDPIDWDAVKAKDPLLVPILSAQPGFTSALQCGPFALVVADLRTERSRKQILGQQTWSAVQDWMDKLPKQSDLRHLLLLSSVPVAYPKLSAAEALLDTFGSEHVTDSNADDLKDHWSHDDHEPERMRLVRQLIRTAAEAKLRAVIVSGDVHVAAWGSIFRNDATPDRNWLRVQQLTASAVLHPAPSGPIQALYLKYLNAQAETAQAIGSEHTAEMLMFPAHNRYIMAARNWLALEPDPGDDAQKGPRLWATWRCEGQGCFSNHLLAVHPAPR